MSELVNIWNCKNVVFNGKSDFNKVYKGGTFLWGRPEITYLTFTAKQNNTTVALGYDYDYYFEIEEIRNTYSFEYSYDGYSWTELVVESTVITLQNNQKVYLRGNYKSVVEDINNTYYSSDVIYVKVDNGKVEMSGNVSSLTDGVGSTNTTIYLPNLFKYNNNIIGNYTLNCKSIIDGFKLPNSLTEVNIVGVEELTGFKISGYNYVDGIMPNNVNKIVWNSPMVCYLRYELNNLDSVICPQGFLGYPYVYIEEGIEGVVPNQEDFVTIYKTKEVVNIQPYSPYSYNLNEYDFSPLILNSNGYNQSPLYFESVEGESIIWFEDHSDDYSSYERTIYFSYDNVNWTMWGRKIIENGVCGDCYKYNPIALAQGQRVYFKGLKSPINYNDAQSLIFSDFHTHFYMTGKIAGYGSLLNLYGFGAINNNTLPENYFKDIFSGCEDVLENHTTI